MIFTERTITIRNDSSSMNAPVILYRGDKNVEVRFTLVESPYKYSNRDSINVIESTDASYAQLVIKTPNDREPIFGDITAVGNNNVTFVIRHDMIDEIEEVGKYDFQIRLFDADQTSMATTPEVVGGFIIKEPIAKEDSNNNITNSAIVGSAVVTNDLEIPTFVGGSYNKTAWHDGDVISKQKLDKMENGIYETYELSKDNSSQIKEKASKNDLANISNGTPLFADDVSGMIDITRNYVNTTNGYLYVYNGNGWDKTDILYQSIGIQDKSVNMNKLDDLILENLNLLNSSNDINNLIPFDKSKWEQGSLSNNSNPTSTVRLRTIDFINVEPGATYNLSFFNDFFTIGINEYNGNLPDGSNYVAWKGYFSTGQTYTPSNNVTKIKLLLAPTQSINPLTTDYISNLSITLRKNKVDISNPISLKVATFNTGLWSDGLTIGVPDPNVNEKGIEWRKLIGSNDCDLVLAQEFTKFFDESKTIDAYEFVWKFKYKNFFRTDTPWTSSALISKYEFKNTVEQAFSNGQPRKWIKSYIEVNGVKVCIINAHLSIQSDYTVARQQEQRELLELMNAESCVILCGDFNAYSTDEFDAFVNAGYKLANGGDFGWFDTWTNFGQTQSSWENKKIDNIIVSSNIDIQNVYIDDKNLSDHSPLIAELVIQ